MKIEDKNIIFYKDSDILDYGEAHIIKNIIDGFVENNKTFYVSTPFINIDFNLELLEEMSKKNADLSIFAKDNFCFFTKDDYINFLKEQLKNDDFISSVNPIASYEVQIQYWDDDLIKGDFTPKPIITFKLKEEYLNGIDTNKLGIFVYNPQTNNLDFLDSEYNNQEKVIILKLENPMPSNFFTIYEKQTHIAIDSEDVINEIENTGNNKTTNKSDEAYLESEKEPNADKNSENNKIPVYLLVLLAILLSIIAYITYKIARR